MGVDEDASLGDEVCFFGGELVRADAAFVLEDVIHVGALEAAEDPAVEEVLVCSVPTDLEIDEVRGAVFA